MAIECEFFNIIIPISNIDRVYEGGFKKFKSDYIEAFGYNRYRHDEYLFRDGAMNSMDIQMLVDHWEELGLKGAIQVGGNWKWKDFCIVESMLGGPTLPCDWIKFDAETMSVYYKEPYTTTHL